MLNEPIAKLVQNVDEVIAQGGDERRVTQAIAENLRQALADGLDIPDPYIQPNPDRYVMYPLYVDPDNRFSIASAVWNVGQNTPVHGHETWGVVGIYSGQEHEIQYDKPTTPNRQLNQTGDNTWSPGEVTVCCTTDDDVHSVECAGDVPCVGIHIYGADIGTLERRSYNPHTGEVSWFVSTWAVPEAKP